MTHTLNIAETVILTILAADKYSGETLTVQKDEQYTFGVAADQKWRDWGFSCGADGYFNLLASVFGQRVKGAKCFCLCGVYDQNDDTAFAIGSAKTLTTTREGTMSFFANDSRGFYFNNKGSIQIAITRNS